MRLLVFTANHPSQKNLRVRYVEAILKDLRQKTPTHVIWVVCQPDRIKTIESDDSSIRDIHEFSNGVELLQSLKPDLVMVSVGIELIQYSFGLSAKFLKIPLISFLSAKIIFQTLPSSNRLQQFLRRMLSSNVATDSSDDGENMRRFKFFSYKLNFLLKTKLATKMNPFKILFGTLRDLPSQATLRPLYPNKISNLYIAHHKNQKLNILKKSIPFEKIVITGHPLLDIIHQKYVKQKMTFQNNHESKILIITDSLFEHGLWTSKQRDSFLIDLFTILVQNNFKFSIKIHPSSENKIYYKKLLHKLNIKSQVFQSEDLWDVITDFNLILSYGYSTSHTEISYAGMRMILLNPGVNLPKFPLVNEGINSGHIQECKNIGELPNQIQQLLKQEIILNDDFLQARNKLFYKFDGKSAERISNAVINLLSKH